MVAFSSHPGVDDRVQYHSTGHSEPCCVPAAGQGTRYDVMETDDAVLICMELR